MVKSPLTQAEQSFVEAMARGVVWGPDYYRDWLNRHAGADAAQPRPAGTPGPADIAPPPDAKRPVLRADIIRVLIDQKMQTVETGQRDVGMPKGVQVRQARIAGRLDLGGVRLDRPLSFVDTVFDHGIDMRDCDVRAVTLDRSVVPHIDAANARVRGHFRARRMPRTDYINLISARIEGHVVLQGSVLNPEHKPLGENGGMALQANAAHFGSSVFLRQGFTAHGCVSFNRARITGQLACVGGRFLNPGGLALSCNAVDVGVDVFLDDGFEAQGEVNFAGAQVGGQFSCFKGRFENAEGVALDCDGIAITSDALLKDGFLARGKVIFVRARIGGVFQLRQHSRVEGDVDMSQARAAVLMDDPGCWPALPYHIYLDGFVYDRFGDGAPLSWRIRVPWLRRSHGGTGVVPFRPQPWNQVAEVLTAMGRDRDAGVVLQKRDKARPVPAGWPFTSLARVTKGLNAALTGYGRRPSLTVVWCLAVIIIGTVIFSGGREQGHLVPRDPAVLAGAPYGDAGTGSAAVPAGYEPFKPWLYSIDLFLPLIDLGQAGAWMPRDPVVPVTTTRQLAEKSVGEQISDWVQKSILDWICKAWFWVHILLGWLLPPLTIAGFAGWLRRP
ncbi:MAG: hypothetical protein ACFB6R_06130 [Alphaproteobacteria bacterium]